MRWSNSRCFVKSFAGSIHKFKQPTKRLQFQKRLPFHLFLVLEGPWEFVWQRLLPSRSLFLLDDNLTSPRSAVVPLRLSHLVSEGLWATPRPGGRTPTSLPAPHSVRRAPRPSDSLGPGTCAQQGPALPTGSLQAEENPLWRPVMPDLSVPARLTNVDRNPNLSNF